MIRTLPVDLLTIFLFFFAAIGLGRKILRLIRLDVSKSKPAEILFFSLGIGWIVFSYMVLALGHLGLLYRTLLWLVIVTTLFLTYKETIAAYLKAKRNSKGFNFTRTEKVLLILTLLAVFFNLFYNYCPPAGDDELTTHLGMPLHWVKEHKIFQFVGNINQYQPLNITMLYTLLTGLVFPQTARLLHFVSGVISAVILYLLAQRSGCKRIYSILASSIFYTMPMVTSSSGVGSTDLGGLVFGLLAVLAFVTWSQVDYQMGWVVLIGVLAGANWGSRNPGFFLVPALAICIFLALSGAGKLNRAFNQLTVFSGTAVIIVLPWYLRTFILTGNPIYPLRLLPGLPFNEFWQSFAYEQSISFGKFLQVLRGTTYPGWGFGAGAMVPAFFCTIFFLRTRNRAIKFLVVIALINFVGLFLAKVHWFISRHAMLSFALASCVSAYAIMYLWEVGILRFILILLVSLSFSTNLVLSGYFGLRRIPVFFGFESKDSYLRRQYRWFEGSQFVEYINKHIPKGTRIFFLGTFHGPIFYYPNHTILGMDTFPIEGFYGTADPLRVLEKFREHNVKYVLFLPKSIFTSDGDAFRFRLADGRWCSVGWLNSKYFSPEVTLDGRTLYKISSTATDEENR